MSSSILERSWSEPGWKDIRSGSEYGTSEETMQQKESSTSLGNTLEEPTAITKCDICLGTHDRTDCKFYYLVKDVPAIEKDKSPSKVECDICQEEHNTCECEQFLKYYYPVKDVPAIEKDKVECDICHEEHSTHECEQFLNYMDKKSSFSDDDDSIASLLSESENEESEAASSNECPVCLNEHFGKMCPYYTSLPRFAKIGPSYQVVCDRCDGLIDTTLECSACGTVVTGYLAVV